MPSSPVRTVKLPNLVNCEVAREPDRQRVVISLTKGPIVANDFTDMSEQLEIGGEAGLDPSTDAQTQRAFRDALGQFCTGVTAITGLATDGEPVGMTVNSFSSLSLEPPLILWSIANTTPSFNCFTQGAPFVVNMLAEDQEALALQFAQSGVDKFEGVETLMGAHGVPIIPDCVAYLECTVDARHPGGDHDIIVGLVNRVFNFGKAPLLFHGGAFHSLSGH